MQEFDKLWGAVMPTPPESHRGLVPDAPLKALAVNSVLKLSADMQKRMESFVRPFDLPPSRMGVLFALFFSKEQLTPSQMGERLFVTRGNMTGLIERLVADRLVRRVRRADDRRAHGLELTEQGRALVKEYFPHHLRALNGLVGSLTSAELLVLAKLLQKVRDGMTTPDPPERDQA
jgi:MarR family transcriptional regulator, organic hydroperoxide resistance regulator